MHLRPRPPAIRLLPYMGTRQERLGARQPRLQRVAGPSHQRWGLQALQLQPQQGANQRCHRQQGAQMLRLLPFLSCRLRLSHAVAAVWCLKAAWTALRRRLCCLRLMTACRTRGHQTMRVRHSCLRLLCRGGPETWQRYWNCVFSSYSCAWPGSMAQGGPKRPGHARYMRFWRSITANTSRTPPDLLKKVSQLRAKGGRGSLTFLFEDS